MEAQARLLAEPKAAGLKVSASCRKCCGLASFCIDKKANNSIDSTKGYGAGRDIELAVSMKPVLS
jgi:hypothetical protein